MATYYVSATGDDGDDGLTKGAAFETFAHAHDVASGGDTIVIVGTINEVCTCSKDFSSGSELTVIPDPTDGGLVDGEFTIPTGGGGLEHPTTGDLSLYKGLVVMSGSYIIWKVDVINSQGRGITGGGHHITIQDCTIDWSRNAGINFNGGHHITCTNVNNYHSGCFYQGPRSDTNWPVAFNFVDVDYITVSGCVSALNWGEGFSIGRNSQYAIVTDCTFYTNMSVNAYVNRAQDVTFLRCVAYHTGGNGVNRSRGFALENESNPSLTDFHCKNVVFAHCLSFGNKRNYSLGAGQNTGDAHENVSFIFCSSVEAVDIGDGKNAGWYWSNVGSTGIQFINCFNYQSDARYASYGGDGATGMTFTKNAYGGNASLPQSAIRHASDVYGALIYNASGSYSDGSFNFNNYRPTQAYAFGSVSAPAYTYGGSLGTTDAEGTTIAVYTAGALEFGGGTPPPVSGAYNIANFQFAMPTSTGEVGYTLTGLEDTPNLIRAYAGYGTVSGTGVDNASLSEGAYAGGNQFAIAQRIEHGAAAEDATRVSLTDCFILLLNPATGAKIAKGAFVSATASELRINWLIAPSSAYLFTIEAMTLPNVYVGVSAVNATEDAYTTVTPSFEAEIIEVYTTGRSIPNSSGNTSWIHSVGIARWEDPTITQYGLATLHLGGADPTRVAGRLLDDKVGLLIFSGGGVTWSLEISDIDSTSFRVYTRDGALGTSADMAVIAYTLGGKASALRLDTSPSSGVTSPSTDDQTLTGLSFKPGYIRRIQSLIQTIDSPITTGDAGAYGVSSILDGSEFSMAWAGEDNAATSNSQTLFEDVAINVPLHDGSTGIEATLYAFTSDGRTLRYTEAPGNSELAIELLIEEATPTPTDSLDAEFTVTPTSGDSPLEVDVDASDSVEVGTTITTWTWDWGDGSDPEEFMTDTASHTYTITEEESPATFTIGLTVSDGVISDYQAEIDAVTVTYAPPPPPSTPPVTLVGAIAGAGQPIEPLGTPIAG